MDRDAVLATLSAHQAKLVAAGVVHAGVFGSVARGEAGPESDIDVMIAFAPGRVADLSRPPPLHTAVEAGLGRGG